MEIPVLVKNDHVLPRDLVYLRTALRKSQVFFPSNSFIFSWDGRPAPYEYFRQQIFVLVVEIQ